MKILKHGNTVKEATCEHCGCIFQYCENDITTERFLAAPFTDYDLDYTWSDVIECPECKSYIILSDIQTEYLEDLKKEKELKKEKKKNSFIESLRISKDGYRPKGNKNSDSSIPPKGGSSIFKNRKGC